MIIILSFLASACSKGRLETCADIQAEHRQLVGEDQANQEALMQGSITPEEFMNRRNRLNARVFELQQEAINAKCFGSN